MRVAPASHLSLHDALPIFLRGVLVFDGVTVVTGGELALLAEEAVTAGDGERHDHALPDLQRGFRAHIFNHPHELMPKDVALDRKSTRLNSSHVKISYAVFC